MVDQGRDTQGCAGNGAGQGLQDQDKFRTLCREDEDYQMRHGVLQGM